MKAAVDTTKNVVAEGLFGPLGGVLADSKKREQATDLAKGAVEAPIKAVAQLPRGLAAEYAGLTGQEDVRNELLKPFNLPGIGEVKMPSGDQRDAGGDVMTPLEMGTQAVETALSAPAGAAGVEGKNIVKGAATSLEKNAARKAEAKLAEYVMPAKPTPKVGKAAILGEKGRSTEITGLRGEIKVVPGEADKEVAASVKGIVNPKKTAQENVDAIDSAIENIAENEVKPFLKNSKKPFNQATINARIRDQEMPELFKADTVLEKSYDLVRARAMKIIAKHPKTMEGLWAARKEFDAAVKKDFPRLYQAEKDTAVTQAIKDTRKTINDFIINETGVTDNKFKEGMKKMTRMYDAMENIAEKGAKEIGSTRLSRFKKAHPTASSIGKMGATAVGLGAAFEGGKSLIGE